MTDDSRASGVEAAPLEVTVVLPCLDEAEGVGLCVLEALRAMTTHGIEGEVVVVDNGSTDASAATARSAGARVISEGARGYGSAILAGLAAARGEIVVMADADHTYPLDRLQELVEPVASGEADLVYGGRLDDATRRSMPFLHRFIGTPVITFLIKRACGGLELRDSQSGFRAFRRDEMIALGLTSPGMEFATEMLISASRSGMRIREVRTGYRERAGGTPKLRTFSDGMRHLDTILLLAPHLFLLFPGALLLLAGVMLSLASLVARGDIQVGSLRWQPVFFSAIAWILGLQAVLAGVVFGSRSASMFHAPRRWVRIVRDPRFPAACLLAGAATGFLGVGIDGWLVAFAPPSSALALAASGLAQSLIISGATLVSFGLIYRLASRDNGAW